MLAQLKHLLLTFEGRLARRRFWFGLLVLVAISIPLKALFALFISGPELVTKVTNFEELLTYTRKGALADMLMTVLLLYPLMAIFTKRLNDDNRSNKVIYIYFALSFATYFLTILAPESVIGSNPFASPGEQIEPTLISRTFFLPQMLIGLYLLFQCGIKRGTIGDNPHGPDPVPAPVVAEPDTQDSDET